ncbi:MAG: hypothetical protein QM651_16915 [Rhodoblastus sp.]
MTEEQVALPEIGAARKPPVVKRAYPQLSERARALLQAAVDKSSRKTVAQQIGYSRPAVSMALSGKYVGDARLISAKIFETFADRVDCPHLGRDIAPAECKAFREAPIPSAPRAAVSHWRACRHCVFNPALVPQSQEPDHG